MISSLSPFDSPLQPKGGWGMDLKFYCPEPWAADKEGKAEAGPGCHLNASFILVVPGSWESLLSKNCYTQYVSPK